MRPAPPSRAAPRRGVTLLVVLVLLTVMLLGGLSLARVSEVGALAAGNSAARDASVHASEVGINTAFAAVQALADENAASGQWYFPVRQASDADGVPRVDFDAAPAVAVGPHEVRYVVERLCEVATPTEPLRECLVRQVTQLESSRAGSEAVDPPNVRQFRITVRVSGLKGTRTFVQALVNRG